MRNLILGCMGIAILVGLAAKSFPSNPPVNITTCVFIGILGGFLIWGLFMLIDPPIPKTSKKTKMIADKIAATQDFTGAGDETIHE